MKYVWAGIQYSYVFSPFLPCSHPHLSLLEQATLKQCVVGPSHAGFLLEVHGRTYPDNHHHITITGSSISFAPSTLLVAAMEPINKMIAATASQSAVHLWKGFGFLETNAREGKLASLIQLHGCAVELISLGVNLPALCQTWQSSLLLCY